MVLAQLPLAAPFPIDVTPAIAVSLSLGAGGLGIIFCMLLFFRVLMTPKSSDQKVNDISDLIRRGANAFLKREYIYIGVFSVAAAAILGVVTEEHWKTTIVFLCGALTSSATGLVGMSIAVRANVRTTVAAERGLNPALRVAFNSGGVMGFAVVSSGAVGLSLMYLIFEDAELLAAFGFGASSVALFARTGGGIFTKAADVGSDLVGKVEANLPEDDPRNAGVIADNVGDNVGDVAGLGSDLFESYCGSLLASAALGYQADGLPGIGLSFWISGFGIISSLIGTVFVRTREGASQGGLLAAMRRGIMVAMGLIVCFSAFGCIIFYGPGTALTWKLFGCILIGLVVGSAIGTWTEWCTSFAYSPTLSIARSGRSGTAPVIIQGISVGMLSTVFPVISLCVAVIGTYELAGTYGTAIAAVGMLSTLGITLATDSFGPVADNAGGIAEMAELPEYVRERTDALDALGNTTAATGKGFAIASAVLTALALIQAFTEAAGVHEVNLLDPAVLSGVLIGVLLPFVFSALTMLAVGAGAQEIIREVRRQFREIPGLMEGTAKCDPAACVSRCTQSALSEMIIPGMMAVGSPIIVGFLLGAEPLAGMLMGAIVGGFLLAVFMANSGGAWDNAKKACEAGLLGDEFKKGTEAHKANVEGDCVGDPFKDVSGPSLDVLAKMMAMVSLVVANLFGEGYEKWWIGLIVLSVVFVFEVFWYMSKKSFANTRELAGFFKKTFENYYNKIDRLAKKVSHAKDKIAGKESGGEEEETELEEVHKEGAEGDEEGSAKDKDKDKDKADFSDFSSSDGEGEGVADQIDGGEAEEVPKGPEDAPEETVSKGAAKEAAAEIAEESVDESVPGVSPPVLDVPPPLATGGAPPLGLPPSMAALKDDAGRVSSTSVTGLPSPVVENLPLVPKGKVEKDVVKEQQQKKKKKPAAKAEVGKKGSKLAKGEGKAKGAPVQKKEKKTKPIEEAGILPMSDEPAGRLKEREVEYSSSYSSHSSVSE